MMISVMLKMMMMMEMMMKMMTKNDDTNDDDQDEYDDEDDYEDDDDQYQCRLYNSLINPPTHQPVHPSTHPPTSVSMHSARLGLSSLGDCATSRIASGWTHTSTQREPSISRNGSERDLLSKSTVSSFHENRLISSNLISYSTPLLCRPPE